MVLQSFLTPPRLVGECPYRQISRWSFQGQQASKAMTALAIAEPLHLFPSIHSLLASTAKWVICLKNKMRTAGSHPPAPAGSTPRLELQLLQTWLGLPSWTPSQTTASRRTTPLQPHAAPSAQRILRIYIINEAHQSIIYLCYISSHLRIIIPVASPAGNEFHTSTERKHKN